MKFAEISDIHLEFAPYQEELPDADILILAGDICVADYLRLERTDKGARFHTDVVREFFDRVCDKYDRIIYVMGNHEHYHGVFNDTMNVLEIFLSHYGYDKVNLLNNDLLMIPNKDERLVIVGSTLWTNFNRGDRESMQECAMGLNDYRCIYNNHTKISTISPSDTMACFNGTESFLSKVIDFNPLTNKIVVVTHHAPSKKSIHPRWIDDMLNSGYSSDLEHLMKPNVKLWYHGHTHDSFDYTVNSTRVICNPSGYKIAGKNYENVNFEPLKVVEI